jgi:hypothetical protein
MLQYDQQKINLETLGTMSPIFKDSNKANINLKICFLTLDWRLEYRFIKPQWTIRNFLRKLFLEKYLKNFSKRLADSLLSEMILAILLWILLLKVKFRLKKNTNTAI